MSPARKVCPSAVNLQEVSFTMNTDSGGPSCTRRKTTAMLLTLSPMKRVQSSPNLATDAWRSQSAVDGFRNGDGNSSSLAAKGFRSVRPNLQDKKTLSQLATITL
ncbi:hypothetical protein CRUP_017494 [Coryphaenoides rupestris]|nr:hypothetical protein CRUP_017494 [Coryphaenoides rupestris]